MGTHRHARANPRTRANPAAIFQCDWFYDQIERGELMVMTAGAEKGALGNADVVPNGDSLQIQQPALLSQPNVVADGQLPRKRDFNLRFDGHIASNPGTKRAQHRPLKGGQAEGTKPE